MPKLEMNTQKAMWKLANSLAKALRAAGPEGQADPQWRVTALASRAWKVQHPELPIVEDEQGASKDTLLQFHVAPDEESGAWFVIAQNKVVGPDTHASPRALIVAKEDEPPNKGWDFDAIGEAAANFFRQQKKELVDKAQSMMPEKAPGDDGPETPQPGAGGGPMASRRAALSFLVGNPIARRKAAHKCELCGKPVTGEFGDVDGAIVCSVCMGWTGKKPDPTVIDFLKRNGERPKKKVKDKTPVWPPRSASAPRRVLLARAVVAGPTLMTPHDLDEFCRLSGIQPNDIPAVKKDLQRRLTEIAGKLRNGKFAWRGNGYSYRAKDPTMLKWESSDGGEFNSSSLLGMLIHAMGRDVDVVENSGYEDWIVPAPKDQEDFEVKHR